METTLRDMDLWTIHLIRQSKRIKKEFLGNPKKLVETYKTIAGHMFEVHTALDWNSEGEWQPAGYIGYCIL